MKTVTQFAMIGTALLIINSLIYFATTLVHLNYSEELYIILRVLDLVGYISLFAFFYTLLQKQITKIKDDEQKRDL
ncbi:hypothetical protein [uncultured Flavobacterium sp.]|uniref:hypothetical protein n=1 Tax=uncultured Flavobacterium sp. TaxID=165435 RepID=UPI0025D9AC81|nr:hypothetical protein [uncultured Flavobacterium sp.]